MKAAAYARYSTHFQKETSIASQLREIAEYCDKNNIEIIDTFIDEAQTGTNINRAGFTRLIESAERKEFEAVVVYDISRGSRDVVDWLSFRKKMREIGVQVYSVTENLGDISDPNTFITELITAGIGQHQVLQSRQKSIAGLAVQAERGKFCGGIPPLGYDIVDGTYIINEREAKAVKTIFQMYADGKSYHDILHAVRDTHGKRGKPLAVTSIHSILRNDRYIGIFSWNRYYRRYMHKNAGKKPNPAAVEIEGIIPPIIERSTWELVQKRLKENTRNRMNKSRAGREYLLSGLIECKKCGGAFSGRTSTHGRHESPFYACITKYRNKTCDAKNISAKDIEPVVINLVKKSILGSDVIGMTADAIIEAYNDKRGKTEIRKEIAELETKINKLVDALENGIVSQSIKDRMSEYERGKSALKEELTKAEYAPEIDRDALVAMLSKDAERMNTELKPVIQKYIKKIQVADDEIIIHTYNDLHTDGSPGAEHVVLKK